MSYVSFECNGTVMTVDAVFLYRYRDEDLGIDVGRVVVEELATVHDESARADLEELLKKWRADGKKDIASELSRKRIWQLFDRQEVQRSVITLPIDQFKFSSTMVPKSAYPAAVNPADFVTVSTGTVTTSASTNPGFTFSEMASALANDPEPARPTRPGARPAFRSDSTAGRAPNQEFMQRAAESMRETRLRDNIQGMPLESFLPDALPEDEVL